jgi:hypothetical protein
VLVQRWRKRLEVRSYHHTSELDAESDAAGALAPGEAPLVDSTNSERYCALARVVGAADGGKRSRWARGMFRWSSVLVFAVVFVFVGERMLLDRVSPLSPNPDMAHGAPRTAPLSVVRRLPLIAAESNFPPALPTAGTADEEPVLTDGSDRSSARERRAERREARRAAAQERRAAGKARREQARARRVEAAEARREAALARRDAKKSRRAEAAEARREAAESRRAAALARRDAKRSQRGDGADARQEAIDSRHAAALARRDAAKSRRAEAAEVRRQAAESRRAAALARREERRQRREDAVQARREAVQARREAVQARREGGSGSSGTLRINSRPWAQVFVDDRMVGTTPLLDLSVTPGRHRVRLVNPSFGMQKSFQVAVGAGERVSRVELLEE